MNVYLPFTPRLPSAYQEVEYIQSSGTQYINTDIKLNNTNWIELKAKLTGANNNWDKLYGGGNANTCLLMQWNNDSTATSDIKNKISITNYNNDYSQYKVYSTSVIQQGDIHTYKHTNTAFYIDGVLQGTCTASTFTMGTGLNIFANSNSNGTGRQKSIYALYYMKIYNSSNNVVYDFVPCYRKSDNVIGLYDLVNNQFYTNSGTGTFSKGSDVTMAVLKNAYIGEYVPRQPSSDTYIYYPFTSNLVDQMGHGNTGTASGSGITYSSSTGIYVPGRSNGAKVTGLSNGIANRSGPFTVNVWNKLTSDVPSNTSSKALDYFGNTSNTAQTQSFKLTAYIKFWGNNKIDQGMGIAAGSTSYGARMTDLSSSDKNWHNYCIVFTGTSYNCYVDGVLTSQNSSTTKPNNYSELRIGDCGYYTDRNANCYVKDYIVETVAWDDNKIADYYNYTKSNYGL